MTALHTAIAPMARLLNRLQLSTKLLMLAGFTILPLLYLAGHSLSRDRELYGATRAELDGDAVILPLTQLVSALHAQRDLQAAGGTASAQSLSAPVEQVSQALAAHPQLGADSAWQTLSKGLAAMDASQALSATHAYITLVAEKSGLLLDPEAAPYFLMILSTERSFTLLDQVGRLRIAALRQEASQESLRASEQALASVDAGLQAFERAGGSIPPQWQKTQAAVRALLAGVRQAAPAATLDPAGKTAMDSITALQASLAGDLRQRLQTRAAELKRDFMVSLALTLAASGATLYFMLAFYVVFMRNVRDIGARVERIGAGNLAKVDDAPEGADELARTSRTLETMTDQLSRMVANIRNSAVLVAESGSQLTRGTGDLAARTEQQAASLEQTASSVSQLVSTVRNNAETASSVDGLADNARRIAESGNDAMAAAVRSMEAIQNDARQVQDIITLIDSIAFQTNILALNAAVEAARAGEQGRGFAVVASEVRHLAQRSGEAAKEIRSLIDRSARQISDGVEHIGGVNQTLSGIVGSVREVADNMRTISHATHEQSTGLSEISDALHHLDRITQSNGQMAEQARTASSELERRAEDLSLAVANFRLRQGVAEEAKALVQQAMALVKQYGTGALERISADPGQRLQDRDMYVFAFDRAGYYRAVAGKPERVGKPLTAFPGIDVPRLLADTFDSGETGPRWVDYRVVNPVTGKVEGKSSYVENLGPDLVIGCGIYKTLRAES